jgi:archaemetzincin
MRQRDKQDSERVICIRPIGPIDQALVRRVRDDMFKYLEVPVHLLSAMPIPEMTVERGGLQYNSTRILRAMLQNIPDDASKLLGIVDKDLCIPILTFVFGEAQLGGRASVVGVARLRQEFHGLPPDRILLEERLLKECLHELGHNFGLVHCQDMECVMYLSNTVRDVDRKNAAYCRDCKASVRAALDELEG